jgi:hypothetical protein
MQIDYGHEKAQVDTKEEVEQELTEETEEEHEKCNTLSSATSVSSCSIPSFLLLVSSRAFSWL